MQDTLSIARGRGLRDFARLLSPYIDFKDIIGTGLSSGVGIDWRNTHEDLLTTGSGTFGSLTVDNITINGATIVSDTGAIGFSNENLTTTGLITAGNLDVDTLNLNGNVITDSTGTISFDNEHLNTTGDVTVGKITIDDVIINNSIIVIEGAAATTSCFFASVVGDGNVRFDIDVDGTIKWGDGTNAVDTNLYRAAANSLKTDDKFTCSDLDVDTLNLNGNVISDSTGTISFSNENLTTTGIVSGNTLTSTVAIGTAPLTVTSTTLVANLNADALDNAEGSYYRNAGNINAGTLKHEYGGLEANVSAYAGLVKITGGATSAVTITAAGEAILDDATATAQRTTLGLGTMATQNANAVAITGGSLSGITTLTVDNININGATITSDTGTINFGNEALLTTGQATFGSCVVDNITVNAAVISSDTGAISFSNENLTTTGNITCVKLTSTEAVAAPFTITSDIMVTNLNADKLDGSHATAFVPIAHVGSGGAAHANAIAAGAAGFLTGADKSTIDGLGTMSTQAANNVNITGGAINATTIGSATRSSGRFSNIAATTYINAQGEFQHNGTPGIDSTFSFIDDDVQTHSVIIAGGIITQWNIT